MKPNLINLTEDLFLGNGSHRRTYINPENSNTVIKILYNKSKDAVAQLNREIKHNLMLQSRYKDLRGVAKYLGKVATNLGEGYIFELIKDIDTDNISESLEEYISRNAFIDDNGEALYKSLCELKNNMFKYGIIPMEMYPDNILCRKSGGNYFDLIIIDDIGTASFIPIEYYFSFAANNRIQRRWNRLLNNIIDINSNPLIISITSKLRE